MLLIERKSVFVSPNNTFICLSAEISIKCFEANFIFLNKYTGKTVNIYYGRTFLKAKRLSISQFD